MPPKKLFTAREDRILIKGLEARENAESIGKRLKVSGATIVNRAKQLGYTFIKGKAGFEWTNEREQKFVDLWMSGVRITFIAEEMQTDVPILLNKARDLELSKQNVVITLPGQFNHVRQAGETKPYRHMHCRAMNTNGERCTKLREGNAAFCPDCRHNSVSFNGYRSSADFDNGAVALIPLPRKAG